MAGTQLKDSALIASSMGGSDIMRIVQKDADASNPTADVLGASGGQVYEVYFKRTSQFMDERPTTIHHAEDGTPVGVGKGNRTVKLTGELYGNDLDMEKLFKTPGIYFKVGDYEPQKTGYLKRVFNLCVANVVGHGARSAGNPAILNVEFIPFSLESATVDAAGVGAYIYTPTEIAVGSLTAIASATDV